MRALMTRKSCTGGMHSAILGNHLNDIKYAPFFLPNVRTGDVLPSTERGSNQGIEENLFSV